MRATALCLLTFALAVPSVCSAQEPIYEVLKSCNDLSSAEGTLVVGPDGALYGTTKSGGGATGTVFRVAPDGSEFGVLRLLGTGGSLPQAGLLLASDGAFYG